ncbi:MAG: hypothetical protein ISP91_17875 [Pseudomonadales bacterium]|jgi:hypothetical protein|nr:hypothetical protein [Pseudomonadales bacterium]
MNWEAIGAIGEIVGSLVVFLTLLVLIRQMKEATNATRASTMESIGDRIQARLLAQAADPALSELHVRASHASTLAEFSEVEQHQLKMWWYTAFNHQQLQYNQISLSATRDEDSEFRRMSFVRQLKHYAIARECWDMSVKRQGGFNLRDDFIAYIQEELGEPT